MSHVHACFVLLHLFTFCFPHYVEGLYMNSRKRYIKILIFVEIARSNYLSGFELRPTRNGHPLYLPTGLQQGCVIYFYKKL